MAYAGGKKVHRRLAHVDAKKPPQKAVLSKADQKKMGELKKKQLDAYKKVPKGELAKFMKVLQMPASLKGPDIWGIKKPQAAGTKKPIPFSGVFRIEILKPDGTIVKVHDVKPLKPITSYSGKPGPGKVGRAFHGWESKGMMAVDEGTGEGSHMRRFLLDVDQGDMAKAEAAGKLLAQKAGKGHNYRIVFIGGPSE
jgi:hypothetical protein